MTLPETRIHFLATLVTAAALSLDSAQRRLFTAASLYLAILDGAMLQSLVGATLFDQEQILTQMRQRFGF